MTQMTDIMVDVETTGLNPHTSSIIQLSAIKFNLAEREIGGMFDRCPAPLPLRGWHEGTREFWLGKNRKVYDQIVARQELARPVFEGFVRWVDEDAPEGGYRFWAKPVTFDWGFVASHMEQLELPMPFHYRLARDMNSYISGAAGDAAHHSFADEVPFHGDVHNALHDCAHQIDTLFHATKQFVSTEVL
jgi:DNA polymerase III epsilon subunit-like protein